MSLDDMDRDLGLWEAGRLSRDHVEARHGVEVATLMNLHEQLAAIAARPIPYNEGSWEALAARLPDRILPTSRQLRRVVALAAAAVLFIGAVSYAAVSPVRRQTDRIFDEIGDLIWRDEPATSVGPPGPGTLPPSAGANGPSSDDSDDEGDEGPGSDDGGDEGNEGPGSDESGDDDEGDEGPGSDDGGGGGDEGDEGPGSDDGGGGDDEGDQDPDDEPDGDGSGSDDPDDSGSGSASTDDDEGTEESGSGDEGEED